jgi:hypothetical protein
LLILCLALATGCGEWVTHNGDTHGHGHSHMIEHIAEGHGVQIGSETNADIVVTRGSNTVTVVFSKDLLTNIPRDCLFALRFSGTAKDIPKRNSGNS